MPRSRTCHSHVSRDRVARRRCFCVFIPGRSPRRRRPRRAVPQPPRCLPRRRSCERTSSTCRTSFTPIPSPLLLALNPYRRNKPRCLRTLRLLFRSSHLCANGQISHWNHLLRRKHRLEHHRRLLRVRLPWPNRASRVRIHFDPLYLNHPPRPFSHPRITSRGRNLHIFPRLFLLLTYRLLHFSLRYSH